MERPAWVCHHCASHLCSTRPRMPPQALANWNWGGREHPQYQNLTMACQSLLGLGKLFMRLVLLKPTDNTDEAEKALVGNTILVAMPSPEMITAELPPTESAQASYFNVVYGAGAAQHAAGKLNKKRHSRSTGNSTWNVRESEQSGAHSSPISPSMPAELNPGWKSQAFPTE